MSDGGGGGPSVTRYTKTFTTSCPAKLLENINNDVAIGPTCLQIITQSVDSIFEFDAALNGAETTALDEKLFGSGSPITGAWSCPAAGTGHAIDDEEIDDSAAPGTLVIWTSNKINTDYYNKTALDGGQLDNRYYTETEANTLFASITHNHAASEITSGTFANARIAESNVTQHEAAINHDALTNFLANEHIDHSTVTITGTNSISGGGSIVSSRTLELVNDAASPGNDKVYGTNGSGVKGWYNAPDTDIDQDHVIYVGKHGNDGNDGKTVNKAVLTFGQALTLCAAETPSVSNQWGVVCLDNGTYSENVAITTQYVRVFAANAILEGRVTLTDHTSFEFEALYFTGGSPIQTAVEMVSGTGTAYGEIKHLKTTNAHGICNNSSGILNVEVEYYEQTGGIGFINSSISHADIQDWDVYGDSPILVRTTGGMTNVRSANHSDRGGSGTSLGYDCNAGTTNVFVIRACPDKLYDVESGATLNLMVIETCGATRENNGTVNELETSHASDTSNPHSTTVDNLNDTTISVVTAGEVLVFDGSPQVWKNQTLAEAGISALAHTHTKSNITDFVEGDYVHDTGNETIDGRKSFATAVFGGYGGAQPPNYSTGYGCSIQSSGDWSYLEILNNGGSGKGVFFGVAYNAFELWSFQGGDIDFYVAPTASQGNKKFTMKNDGVFQVHNLGAGVVKTDATGKFSANVLLKSDVSDFTESDYVHTYSTGAGSPIPTEAINGDKTFNNDVVIQGNLTVNGTEFKNNVENLTISDNIILLNEAQGSPVTPTENSGIEVDRYASTNASLIWNESTDKWTAGLKGSETEISLSGHTHVEADITDFGSYEPAFSKNTAFNKNFGTTLGTVSEGNHNHDAAYSVVGHNHDGDYVELTGDTMTGNLELPAGTFISPSLTFTGATDTGIYKSMGSTLGLAAGGDLVLLITEYDIQPKKAIEAADYSATAPSYAFAADTNTGMYRIGTDQLGFSTGGVLRLSIDNGKVYSTVPVALSDGTSADPSLMFANDTDTGLYRFGANGMTLVTGGVYALSVDSNQDVYIANTLSLSSSGSNVAPVITWGVDTDTGIYRVAANWMGFVTNGINRFGIESNGTLNVGNTSNYENLVTQDDDIPNKKYVDDACVFGTQPHYIEQTGWMETTSTTWQEVISVTTSNLPNGTYRVGWTWIGQADTVNRNIGVRVQVDDTTTITDLDDEYTDVDASPGGGIKRQSSGFKHMALSGVTDIDLDFRRNATNTATVRICDARIELWRVS